MTMCKRLIFFTIAVFSIIILSQICRAQVPGEKAQDCGCKPGSYQDRLLPHYVEIGTPGCPSPVVPPEGVYGYIRYSHLSELDWFGDHDWHDFDFYLALDLDYVNLVATGSTRNNNSFLTFDNNTPTLSKRNERLMEVEWDSSKIDQRYWATAGDRLWMKGKYIWDCGHPEPPGYVDPYNASSGYHTEFHPPKAIALTRLEPYVFNPGEAPGLSNKTYVYLHGRSGLKYKGQPFHNSSVATEDYDFVIPVPQRPAGYPAGKIPIAKVVSLPYGGPLPELTVKEKTPGNNSEYIVKVHYPLKQLNDPSPNRRFAAEIVSGWPPMGAAGVPGVTFQKLRIKFDELVIRKRHTPICQADWKLWINVNGEWRKIDGTGGVNNGTRINLDHVGAFDVILPNTPDARLTIQVSGWVSFYDEAFGLGGGLQEVPVKFPNLFSQFLTADGKIGRFFKQFTLNDNFGVGLHDGGPDGELSATFESIDSNVLLPSGGGFDLEELRLGNDTSGDFGVKYQIERIQ